MLTILYVPFKCFKRFTKLLQFHINVIFFKFETIELYCEEKRKILIYFRYNIANTESLHYYICSLKYTLINWYECIIKVVSILKKKNFTHLSMTWSIEMNSKLAWIIISRFFASSQWTSFYRGAGLVNEKVFFSVALFKNVINILPSKFT